MFFGFRRLSSLRLMMELENAVALLNRTDTFFKINVADVKELRHQYGLPPVLKIFRKGKAYDYKGPKVTKGLSVPFETLMCLSEGFDIVS